MGKTLKKIHLLGSGPTNFTLWGWVIVEATSNKYAQKIFKKGGVEVKKVYRTSGAKFILRAKGERTERYSSPFEVANALKLIKKEWVE